ncbi:MAG: hypothetical protein SVO26_05340 [Chloroflexota bacterium]|nr:hypothetical protein [Chloroflexota bacterium]
MMNNLLEARESKTENDTARTDCVHHWIIESPEGPTSKGVCKYCGEERVFQNYVPYSSWEENTVVLSETFDFPRHDYNDDFDEY